jgi:hypothetical protein
VRNPPAVLGRVPASQIVKLPLFKKFFLTHTVLLLSPFASHKVMRPFMPCLDSFRLSTLLRSVGPLLVRIYTLFFYFASLIPHPLYTLSLHCLFICINLYRHALIIIQVFFTLIYLSFCLLLYLSSLLSYCLCSILSFFC